MQPNSLAENTPLEMHAEPLSDGCQRIWQRGEHALIGISAGNSYFNQERLTALLEWAGNSFREVDVVYVDTHIDTMLIADGRTPESAMRSVKATLKDVRRRIRRALERLGPEAARFRVRALSELMELPVYQAVRKQTDQAIEDDREFSSICEAMVQEIVQSRPGAEGEVTPEHLRAGLSYVQAEAPLFADSPSIFEVSTSVVLYHMKTPISEYLAQQPTGFRAAPGQAFVVVKPSSMVLAGV
ncbi:tRNA-dependent cyclodipeptide synthase [Streptomyces sp. NPDC001407]|uniref:tRNA-dependent cyclodipeptide synthase n=1 Tax=unclassified Streptomyces TaxID=2593676 RepID=UPI0033DDF37A